MTGRGDAGAAGDAAGVDGDVDCASNGAVDRASKRPAKIGRSFMVRFPSGYSTVMPRGTPGGKH
jgi:hypothetical protein